MASSTDDATDTVRSAPFTIEELENSVAHPGAGAIVSFAGVVRDNDSDRSVIRLTYEAHPSAADTLASIVAEICDRPGVICARARHRVGTLAIGDLAFGVAVSAAHRGDAFAACADLVERVKVDLPVWKHQEFADGTSEWVNCA